MAGNKLIISHRVAASTILEVIIAMVLILVVFSIAMMISANVMRSSLSVKKIKAAAILQDVMIKTEQSPASGSQSQTVGEFRIKQNIKPYEGNSAVFEIDLAAIDANADTIATLKKLYPK